MRETTYSGAGVFDRPLSDYEKVFRPLLNEKGFLETLETIPGRKHLVLDLMTSGFNLTDFLGKAASLAVGLQRSDVMTVEDLAKRGVTYLHADLTDRLTWREIDRWLDGDQLSLVMSRPEGALYDSFWNFENFWNLLVWPTLERLAPGGYLFFQTPYRFYIGEGDSNFGEYAKRWRLNTTYRVDEMERLETFIFGLNGCGFEAEVGVANLRPIPRPYFDLLMRVRNTA
ncbi:hypothetical protein A3A84_01555 [Candidatus Collierbacteria bacterium RIFCSPLOWO2_01_FULL_50_23]|uniref:Methyltransferase domain-containing protein n=2 Tax=Candidatus Collieribacteriota TaxID=1752725 RepID=A0A1F5EY36_9BACT|nr:MAG: hypothetical protein A2703_00515 [Candidatus Collierbacteria bacterium RIFCSPHIGHO2_01_FULL_50_25]OGD72206.1 MAG: hypothetical protein A3D09_01660 [Candidatus Collierbacteria bacterium RIFCSPHIGHO2_02_FULL_49_10]OGD74901.1 MAG: hypothetical protein A3A84_01555 [Candidatus Collierbacteria bacterium RIFCSPLOWO2_01_FULL_50_23]